MTTRYTYGSYPSKEGTDYECIIAIHCTDNPYTAYVAETYTTSPAYDAEVEHQVKAVQETIIAFAEAGEYGKTEETVGMLMGAFGYELADVEQW